MLTTSFLTATAAITGIFGGHQEQSQKGIWAHGSYIPAIIWQCLRQKDDFSISFSQIRYFRRQLLVHKVLQLG